MPGEHRAVAQSRPSVASRVDQPERGPRGSVVAPEIAEVVIRAHKPGLARRQVEPREFFRRQREDPLAHPPAPRVLAVGGPADAGRILRDALANLAQLGQRRMPPQAVEQAIGRRLQVQQPIAEQLPVGLLKCVDRRPPLDEGPRIAAGRRGRRIVVETPGGVLEMISSMCRPLMPGKT